MGLYSITNMPTALSGLEISGSADGELITIWAEDENGKGKWRMTDTYIGDHMLTKPAELRQMIAQEIAAAITKARDIGYQQALAQIRSTLGVK